MVQLASKRRESMSAAGVQTATDIDRYPRRNGGTATARDGIEEPVALWQTPFGIGRQMLETSMRMRTIWADGIGTAMQAQLAAMQAFYDDAIRCRESLLATDDVEHRTGLMLDFAREAVERGFANWLAAAQLFSRPANEIVELLTRQAEQAVPLLHEVNDRAA